MPSERLIRVLNLIADQLEELFIERDAYAAILARAGYTAGDLRHIAEDAKCDPETLSKAHLALADLRTQLLQAGVSSPFEELAGKLPPPDQQN